MTKLPPSQQRFLDSRWAVLLFILICFAVSSFGALFVPGEWYAQLNRAPWSPPNMVFPIVWTLLYLMIAVAGWLLFRFSTFALKMLWIAQLVINASWSWVFFAQHWVLLGLIIIVVLCFMVASLIYHAHRQSMSTVVYLLTPYLLWLMLASSLNGYIWLYN